MILFLDTSGFDYLKFGLVSDKADQQAKTIEQRFKIHHFDSEKTLPALRQFLKKHHALPVGVRPPKNKISKIILVSGPGSFSGLRVGASIALAFGFAWNVPVHAIKKDKVPHKVSELVRAKTKKVSLDFEPEYGSEPKITKEKKKQLKNT